MAPTAAWKRRALSAALAAAAATAGAVMIAALPTARAAKVLRGVDFCGSYSRICSSMVSQMDCRSQFDGVSPKPSLAVQSCKGGSYDTFVGRCQCAALDLSPMVIQEIVDFSVLPGMPLIVQPSKLAANATDFGVTFVKACNTFLSGAQCPAELHTVAGYGAKYGFSDFRGQCACGNANASEAIRDAVAGYLFRRKLPATVARLPTPAAADGTADPAAAPLDTCATFDAACHAFLDDIVCPAPLRANRGCATPGAPETLVGTCRCGAMDASESLKLALLGLALPGEAVEAAKVPASASARAPEGAVEFCQTYANACKAFLTQVGVAPELHDAEPNCVGGDGTNLATFRGRCVAAPSLDVSTAVTSFLLGSSVEQQEASKLVCLGDDCASRRRMSHGTMSIIITSGVLAAFGGLLIFAYRRAQKRVP